jgi:hypothetical protein
MKTDYKIDFTKNMMETQVADFYVKHPIKLTDEEWMIMKEDMDFAIKTCIFKVLSEKKAEFQCKGGKAECDAHLAYAHRYNN